MYISHNAPYLPPPPPQKKILHNLWFSFLLGITAVPIQAERPLERGYNEFQSNGSTAKSWTFCGLLYGIDHGKVSQTCME